MKFNFFIFIFVFLSLTGLNVFTQSREEIKDKFNTIISNEKYDYQIENINKGAKEEPSFIKFLNRMISFIKMIFEILVKFLSLFWKTSPVFFIIFMIILISLPVLFVYWVARQINISFDKKTRRIENFGSEELHFDYIKEMKIAKKFMSEKKYKEAVSVLINALWLFYYHKKILKYDKSRTNREYLKFLINLDNYESLKQLIFKAEKAVYYKESINEGECEEILWNVSEIFSQ